MVYINEFRVGEHHHKFNQIYDDQVKDYRLIIEPWFSALFQSEHLSLLIGSGFTTAVASIAGTSATGMDYQEIDLDYADKVEEESIRTAEKAGRGNPNLEDQIRAILTLKNGLKMLDDYRYELWEKQLNKIIRNFLQDILKTERALLDAFKTDKGKEAKDIASSFLLSFANRTASRERLNIFTTNYDRLIEYVSDLLGLRIIDRFIGTLTPIYRSSRLGVDMHYNPPGIRGEPRYLEGVVRMTKLHGSIDWRFNHPHLRKYSIPFGAPEYHTDIPTEPGETVMIYPNPAKDVETLEFPYADLFRDFSNAISQHNSVLVTYGYGFGDDHINRAIRDMLTIPSTHLVIISYDDAGGRIPRFINTVVKQNQITLLMGKHFGDLKILVQNYLPKPALDYITLKRNNIMEKRNPYVQTSLMEHLNTRSERNE